MRYEVDEITGCWNWTGKKDKDGYGVLGFRVNGSSRAHRVFYAVHVETPPAALPIDHLCRNRACVNPEHLRLVTPKINTLENSESIQAANATKSHCVRGHEFTNENTLVKDGRRICRKCKALHAIANYRRQRGEEISLEDLVTLEVGPHNRDKTHCKNGHPLSGDNLKVAERQRVCLTCRRESNRQYKLRKKAR